MKHCKSFALGMGAGIMAGAAACITIKCMCGKKCKFTKRTSKAAKAVSDIMDDLHNLLN